MGTQVWIDGEFGLNPNIMDDVMATMEDHCDGKGTVMLFPRERVQFLFYQPNPGLRLPTAVNYYTIRQLC